MISGGGGGNGGNNGTSGGAATGGAAGPINAADNAGPGVKIEGDSKDVTASHMTNNSHNEMNLHFG